MLSNLVVTTQRFVLVIDELGQERIARKFIFQLLREQGQYQERTTKTLPLSNDLKDKITFWGFLNECRTEVVEGEDKCQWNVLLPSLSDLLCFQSPAVVFQFIHALRKIDKVERIFLWASTRHLMHEKAGFVLAACEHMADLVLHLQTPSTLSIVTRRPGGGVTHKRYNCTKTQNQFLVTPALAVNRHSSEEENAAPKPEQLGTFKIELDEDELVARNALKLPYEKTSEPIEGNIIYTPDDKDDFDDEDPDEDLCI